MEENITKKSGRKKLAENLKKQSITIAVKPEIKKQLEKDVEEGKIRSISGFVDKILTKYYKKHTEKAI